jgi:hypothetical protein
MTTRPQTAGLSPRVSVRLDARRPVIEEAKQDLAKGKENIKAGLAALKTAIDAER